MGDGFYSGQKTQPTVLKYGRKHATKENPEKNKQQKIHIYIQNSTQ